MVRYEAGEVCGPSPEASAILRVSGFILRAMKVTGKGLAWERTQNVIACFHVLHDTEVKCVTQKLCFGDLLKPAPLVPETPEI